MSRLFATGFDLYGTSQMLQIWTAGTVDSISSASSRWSTGQGVHLSGAETLNKALGSNESTLIAGFAFNPTSPSSLLDFFRFRDVTTTQISLACTATGQLACYQGGTGGTQLAATAGGYLVGGIWHYIEIKAVFATGATGSIEVRVDGNATPVLTASSVITATTHAYANDIFINGSLNINLYDDIYVINTSGAVNNDFLGDTRIEGRVPTGVGNYAQFTPSTGSNWQNVDDIPPNDDTDYNSTSTVNNKDSFAHQSLSSLSGTVRWVSHDLYARKDDAGTRKAAPLFRISGTDYVGSDDTLSTSYQYFRQHYETSPATSTAWTISEINNAEVGYKLTV